MGRGYCTSGLMEYQLIHRSVTSYTHREVEARLFCKYSIVHHDHVSVRVGLCASVLHVQLIRHLLLPDHHTSRVQHKSQLLLWGPLAYLRGEKT